MTVLTLVLVISMAVAVIWLAYEVLRLRQERSEPSAPSEESTWTGHVEGVLADLGARVEALEAQIPRAIQHVGVINYDAYGDISGGLSRSIALLDWEGNGVVISQLVGRTDNRLYVKGVLSGSGEEPLSPEEEAAIRQALTSY